MFFKNNLLYFFNLFRIFDDTEDDEENEEYD